MCLWVSAPSPSASIKLSFGLERIYLRYDGSVEVTTDFLIENTGQEPIDKLRVILRHPLVDTKVCERSISEQMTNQIFTDLYQHQIDSVHLRTHDFFRKAPTTWWPYTELDHVRLAWDNNSGALELTRIGQKPRCDKKLRGFVKQNWKVVPTQELNNNRWLWYVLSLRGPITCVDLTVPKENLDDHLRGGPNERMWHSINFRIPPKKADTNRSKKFFRASFDYSHTFMSSDSIATKVYRLLADPWSQELLAHPLSGGLHAALPIAQNFVKSTALPEVCDWRTIVYSEPGVNMSQPVFPVTLTVASPDQLLENPLPKEAYGRLGKVTRAVYSTPVPREFWVGNDHDCPAGHNCSVNIRSTRKNPVYLLIAILIIAIIGAFVRDLVHLKIGSERTSVVRHDNADNTNNIPALSFPRTNNEFQNGQNKK